MLHILPVGPTLPTCVALQDEKDLSAVANFSSGLLRPAIVLNGAG